MTPVFRLDHIVKRYKQQLALDDVSLESSRGVVMALLGENGAGKTTALKILLGLTEPDSGAAEVFGLDSRLQGCEIRRRVGYVPEQITLYDWMTVAEVGWFAAGFYPGGYLERYRRLIEQFDLSERKKVKSLSKGMRAKVALSVAMAHDPELLVLDEPTSGLDAMVRREFLESMVDVAAEGRTVLLSSHQIAEVERVADVVAIIRHAKLVTVEKLDDLKRDVRELTVTLRNGTPEPPDIDATVIRRQRKDRQWKLMVRGFDESRLPAVRSDANVGQIEVRTPSLEEIFVAYMKPDPIEQNDPKADETPASAPQEQPS